MADVATLGLKVDASGALQGIGAVETKLQKLETSANQAGALLSKAFLAGGAALGALGALVIKNTAEADAAFAQLSATVKSTGGVAGFTAEQLRDTAGMLQNVSVFGDEAVQSMQAVLLTFTNVRGEQFTKASSAILDMSQALGTDLKSAAIQVGKALNDPILGVSSLARAGVQFSESQKAMLEQMVRTGDIAGAQTIILKELETQFGGSALAARNTMGGALAALRNAFGDLLEVPSIIAPVTVSLNAMVDVLKDPAAVQGVKTFVQDTVFLLGSLAQAFLELTAVAINTVGGLARLFGKLSPSNSPLNQAADAADRWSAALVNTAYAIEGIQTRIAEFTPSVTKAGKAVAIATPQVDALTKAVKLQDEAVSEGATAWYEFFKSLESTAPMQTVADNFGDLVEVIEPKEAQVSAWSNFLGWLSTEAQFTTDNLGSAFAQTFQNIAARGKATMGDLFATIGGLFGKKADGTQSTGAAIFGPLAVGASIIGDIILRGKAERKAAIDALKADMDAFTDAITGFAESFRVRGSQFAEDTRRNTEFAEKQRKEIAELDNVLTKTAFRLLQATGGDVDAAIRRRTEQVQRDIPFADPFDDVAVKQLMQYKEQMEQLTQVTKEATAAAEDARRVREQERNDDLDVRRLQALGRDEEADALRLQIAQNKERRQAERDLSQGEITRDTFDKLIEVLRLEQQAQTGATQTTSGPIQSLAAAQVQDIDRVVGELTTIRVRSGQVVSLLTQLVRGGGIIGAVNSGLQNTTSRTQVILGNIVVS